MQVRGRGVIAGIGIDVVDIARFERSVERTPALLERLFAESERNRPARSLAARFAAKEALIKALGGHAVIRWHEMTIVQDDRGQPRLRAVGRARRARARSSASTGCTSR